MAGSKRLAADKVTSRKSWAASIVTSRKSWAVAILFALAWTMNLYAARPDGADIWLTARIPADKIYAGQAVVYEVVLNTTQPESVQGIELSEPPSADGARGHRTQGDRNFEAAGKGTEKAPAVYTAVVDRYHVSYDEAGTYTINGGVYVAGLVQRVNAAGMWGGNGFVSRTVPVHLSAPDLKVKVKPLPVRKDRTGFTGPVGEFAVETYLPGGTIKAGQEAVVIVSVSGTGDLSGVHLPDVRFSFPDTLGFSSMTDSVEEYVKEGKYCNELEIECTFTPREAGDHELGKVRFEYFNPRTGKYETAESSPLRIHVESSGTHGQSLPPVAV